MAISARTSFDNWLKREAEKLARQEEENKEYDLARQKELQELQQYETMVRNRPQTEATRLRQWDEKQNEIAQFLRSQEETRRKSQLALPGHHWGYTVGQVLQDLQDPNQSWKYYQGADAPALRTAAMNIWNQPFSQYQKVAAPAPSPIGIKPMVRVPRVTDQVREIPTGLTPGNLGTTISQKYGKDFLGEYGANVLGMKAGMSPLQRMFGLAEDFYSIGDLPTGSQASRDYFASNLWDYLESGEKLGDFSAITENPMLKNYIGNQLGLGINNYDQLLKDVQNYYGHVRM